MRFSDVVAQEGVKNILRAQADSGRLPHAVMLCGREGAGKLALALALARYLLCKDPSQGEPCGECPSCRMTRGWAHPDLHFSFPVIKKKAADRPTSDDFLPQWRQLIAETPYFTEQRWLQAMAAQNQQMMHYVFESDALRDKLSLKPSQGGRRAIVMWLPEKMNEECANKLLKLMEEPPPHTHIIMVSQSPELVVATIRSRAQAVRVPPLTEEETSLALQERTGAAPEEAARTAHLAQGSYTQALRLAQGEDDNREPMDLFVSLMRTCYARKIRDMRSWSDRAARLGRERQKETLRYFQRMVRESFAYNLRRPRELNYMTPWEEDFARRFALFVNERNVEDISRELSLCQRDIEQNTNPRMVFFDLSMKITILLRR